MNPVPHPPENSDTHGCTSAPTGEAPSVGDVASVAYPHPAASVHTCDPHVASAQGR